MTVFPDLTDRAELLTVEQMAEADRLAALAGQTGLSLMEAAGRAVAVSAEEILRSRGHGECPVTVLCGPGNNGGDGFVAARLLRDRGFQVDVFLAGDEQKLAGDAAHMAAAWFKRGTVRPIAEAIAVESRGHLIVDALFGAGLSRPLDGDVAKVVEKLNAVRAQVVAVDVPSGLDGNTGEVIGCLAVRAERTVTFFRLKPAHVLYPGRGLCGRIELADIGIPDAVLRCPENDAEDGTQLVIGRSIFDVDNSRIEVIGRADAVRPAVHYADHKYTRGHAVVVSGVGHRTGAARLAARAALRAGAGLVTVASPGDAVAINAAHLTAIMIAPFHGPEGLRRILADRRKNAIVLGPALGAGFEGRRLVEAALVDSAPRHHLSIVLDADALTAFQSEPEALFDLIARSGPEPIDIPRKNPRVVLTPHEGEFKRLFPDIEGSKLARARMAADRSGAVIVLKGADTVVAAPCGSAAVAVNAPPWLATAGSGDVLAGLIAGEMARGRDAYGAARAAVWMHGACANRFGVGLIAEDLPEMLPEVLRDLHAEAGDTHGQQRIRHCL